MPKQVGLLIVTWVCHLWCFVIEKEGCLLLLEVEVLANEEEQPAVDIQMLRLYLFQL